MTSRLDPCVTRAMLDQLQDVDCLQAGIIFFLRNVRYWHLAEIDAGAKHVRF
jgi:hypothetical protein